MSRVDRRQATLKAGVLRPVVLVALCGVCASAHAEDSIGISGNYYKERSTRIYEPLIRLTKDLPYDSEIDVTYMVDNITSASAAFTSTDEPFSEFRHEIRLGGRVKLFDLVTPGISFRYSNEPDYKSFTVGGDLSITLFDDNTTFSAFANYQSDDVAQRNTSFTDELASSFFGLGYTQVVRKDLIGGLGLEMQSQCGYQENPYRSEFHPRKRRRWTVSGWLRYRNRDSGTTVRGTYRFYRDSWSVQGHTGELRVHQRITRDLEIQPRVRLYTQRGAFFEQLASRTAGGTFSGCERSDSGATTNPQDVLFFSTEDPKLTSFGSGFYGLQLSWKQSWLKDTPLDAFRNSYLEPAYYFFDQGNRYDKAHIAQLNWFWPF